MLLTVSAGALFAQNNPPAELNPIKWSLKRAQPTKSFKAGDKFTLQLTAKIDDGWHLYSTEEIPRGPRPTRIVLAPDQPFELGEIESPTPNTEFDKNFGVETEYYEHSATFTLPVRVKPKATAGIHKVAVQVRFQSCSETLCLAPRLVKLHTQVRVRAASQ